MDSQRLCLFSFRFDRRGRTNLWALEGRRHDIAPVGYQAVHGRARPEVFGERREWIEVPFELSADACTAEEEDDAEDLARTCFKLRHPGTDLLN